MPSALTVRLSSRAGATTTPNPAVEHSAAQGTGPAYILAAK